MKERGCFLYKKTLGPGALDQVAQDAAKNTFLVRVALDQWQLQLEGKFWVAHESRLRPCVVSTSLLRGNQWRTKLRVKVNVTAKSGPWYAQ